MGMNPRDVPFDRSMVQGWVDEWLDDPSSDKPSLEAVVRQKVHDQMVPHMPTAQVTQAAEGDESNLVHIADLIVSDLRSYLSL